MDKTYCPSEAYVLTISYHTPRECVYELLKYKKKKTIEFEPVERLDSLQTLNEKIIELPVIVVVQGKKVLSKYLEGKNLKDVFPNIDLKDFQVELTESKASLIRNSDLDEILETLSFKDCITALFFDGEIKDSKVELDNYLSQLKAGKKQELEFVRVQNQSEKFKHLTKKVGVFAMAIFLFLLLMNVMIFDQFNKQKRVLSSSIMQNNSVLEQLNTLQSDLDLKQEFFNNTSWMHSTNFSFYVSEIGRTVIKDLTLDELSVNPVSDDSKRKGKLRFKEGEILVKGHCTKSATLNKWKKKVKDLDWVKSVDVRSFERDNKDGGTFQLLIDAR